VDQSTGSITLRADFPNRNRPCCRGCLSVRSWRKVSRAGDPGPPAGGHRNQAGNAMVMVVGAEEKVEPRVIKVERTVGDSWL